jgi:type I restriction enzyme S subunit
MAESKLKPEIRFTGFTDAWEQRKLGELCDEFHSGEFIKADSIASSGGYPVYGGNGLRGYTDTYNHNGDFALIGRQGALCGNMQFSCGKAYFTEHAIAVRANNSNDTRFLYHLFGTMNLGQYSGQSAQPGLAVGNLIEIETSMPDKAEQVQISTLFCSLDRLITLHQREYDKTVNVKKAMLEKMFPKDGTDRPEIRFAGFTDAWEQRRIGGLTNVLSASRVHKEEWTLSGVPFYRSSDVVSAYKGANNERAFISENLFEQLSKISGRPEKDDIFLTGGGSIGIPYKVPDNKPLYTKDADLLWVKHSANFDSQYLYTYFTTPSFRSYVSSISHIGTIAHYTIEQVKATPVSLPNIDEQRKLGQFFTALSDFITLHQHELKKLQNMKKALLEKMFV